ncbi:MAG: hypothetical protein NTV51_03295 [Verrucomicrobia bacterium]|nr:hypothetical protein [Verrucomicrobiota bacterium]
MIAGPSFAAPRPVRNDPRTGGGRAFSLIEVMVVVGLIATLVLGFGFALRDNAGSSLVSAQNILGTLVGQARAQAAVNQTDARVVIYNTRNATDPEKYLRVLQVFISVPVGNTTDWQAVGDPVYLPRGVFVVPPVTNGLLAPGVTWPTNPAPVSNLTLAFSPSTTAAPVGTAFNRATTFYVGFSADGTVTPTPNPYLKLVVTTGALSAGNLPAFNNPGAVRGILIRPNGAVSYVNDATGF